MSHRNAKPLSHFNLPRTISRQLKLFVFFSDSIAIMGFVFFFFGLIFLLAFVPSVDFSSVVTFSDSDPVTKGILINKCPTSCSENDQTLYDYEYHYRYGGKLYSGHSFALSGSIIIGDTVNVKYVLSQPERSRMEAMRAAPFGIWLLFPVSLLSGIGSAFLIIAVIKMRKNLHLLQNGLLGYGQVIRKEATVMQINSQTVYRVYFRFKSQDGALHETFVRTHRIHKLGDEGRIPLVYDLLNRSVAISPYFIRIYIFNNFS